MTKEPEITQVLNAAASGDAEAADRLLAAVYQQLRSLAAAMTAREAPGRTIQATDLVHEAYIRLFGKTSGPWNGRRHFFGAAAEAMRRILIEQHRRRTAVRRGGGRQREALSDVGIVMHEEAVDLLALDEALDRLDREEPVKATLVKLRYFAGLTIPQAADAMGISRATAERYWAFGRARLYQWVEGEHPKA